MNFHLTPLSRLFNASFFAFFSICVFNTNELEAASFDCSKASNKVERTICSVDSISSLDDKLGVAYKNAGSSYKQSQRDWLKKRNKCGADVNCLINEYKARVDFLINAASNPPSASKRIVTSNLADCAPNVFHNCYGTYTWDTGEKYVGEWQNRRRVGNGVFTYKNGNKYTGSWQSNVPDGQGSLLATDGKVYVGQWIDGQYQQPSQTQNIRNEAKNTDKNVKLSNDKSRQLYQVLASNRWTLGGMPCDYNGGTYIEYNGKFKYGQRLTANGAAAAEGDAPGSSVFTENLDSGDPASGYLVLKYEAYPPKRLLNMGFPTGEKTAFGVRNISFDGTTLTEVHSYQTLNLQVFLTSNKVVYEPIKQEKVVRVKCSN